MKLSNVSTKTRVEYFAIQGGEDLDTPQIALKPGMLSMSRNYECDINGRARRIDGYEVFDGRPKPSAASYWILHFTDGTEAVAAGATLLGPESLETGEVLSQVVTSGSYAGDDAAGYFVLTNVTGDYDDGEPLHVSGLPKAFVTGTSVISAATTDALHAEYLQAAIEAARDKIAAVPGTGDILGVYQLAGTKVAFRNAVGGATAKMYKATTAGWAEVDLGRTVAFTSGGAFEVVEGAVITGATSTAFATVKRVILTSGAWADGDAAGKLVLYSQTGNFASENLNVGANLNVATIAGNSAAVSLSPSGTYEFITHNFYGSTATLRMYGCDGVNPALEWDGTTFVQIATGMTTDKPTHIAAHRNHLFLSFAGGSLQHSSLGEPYAWSVITGAAEIGIGDDITSVQVVDGATLAIWARNSTSLLYGTSIDDWELKQYALKSGGIEKSIQCGGFCVFMDDRGLTTLSAIQEYGDFKDNIISKPIQSFIEAKKESVACSVLVREKNQYRLFFDDKQALFLTMSNNKVAGFMRILYDVQPVCCTSSENATGYEEVFFGTSNGFVYQMDAGTSFNGNEIEAILKTHFHHLKTPSTQKRFRKIRLEVDAPPGTEIYARMSYDYGEAENTLQTFDVSSGGGIWGFSDWAAFVWNAPVVDTAEVKIYGSGANFSVVITSTSTYIEPHTIQGVTVHYDFRGLKR